MSSQIKNKFIQSILEDFSNSFAINEFDEAKQFEYLVNYLIVSKIHPEAFDSVDELIKVDVDPGSNYGIDAAAVLINDNLVTNVEDIAIFRKSKKLDVRLIFIQSKTSRSYESGEILKFGSAVENFFSDDPKIEMSEELIVVKKIYDELLSSSNIRLIDRKRFPVVELHFANTSSIEPNETINTVKEQISSNLQRAVEEIANVSSFLHGTDYIIDTFDDLSNRYSVTINFKNRLDLDKIDGVSGSYIGYLSYNDFFKLITDSNGIIRRNIFYENVRDFQGMGNKVNGEIAQTLKCGELRDKFILFNNGITVVCKRLIPLQGNEYELGDFQVVNGCQTSNLLYLFKEDLEVDDSIWIPIKLIHTESNDVINSIVKATNRQTPVPDEAFIALEKFHQNLQKFYVLSAQGLSEKIYYERRSREYQNDDSNIVKYRIISLHKQIRSFTAIMLNEPHTVASNNPSNILSNKKEVIFHSDHRFEPYFIASYILFYISSDLARGIIKKWQILYIYYIAMLYRIVVTKRIKLSNFAGKDAVKDMEIILKEINDIEKRKSRYKKIFSMLNKAKRRQKVHNENISDRDLIRLRAFRDEVIRIAATENDN